MVVLAALSLRESRWAGRVGIFVIFLCLVFLSPCRAKVSVDLPFP